MNHMFRIIWSKALGAWVVASELTTRRSKSGADSGRCQALVVSVGIGALAIGCWSSPATAQVWRGTTSSDWTVGSNWSTGAAPSGTATVTINTNSPNPTVLGVSGAVNSTIGNLQMGTATGTSALTIQNGSTLSSSVTTGTNQIGQSSGATNATITVTGTGSSWSMASSTIFGAALGSTGTLNVANGATASLASNLAVGQTSGGRGVLNVTNGSTLTTGGATIAASNSNSTGSISGAGSQWNVGGALTVGLGRGNAAGVGTLNIANGAVVTATGNITIGGLTLSTSGAGAITVDGAGSRLSTGGALNIGLYSTGSTLTVSDGAVVTANTVTVTALPAAKGTLNLSSSGTLATQALTGGPGTAQVNFDGATLRATASNTAFISGFTATGLNIAAGGLTLDTGAFNVTAASPFSGTGALTKVGTGTATFTGDNTYTGGTTISAGTLQLGNGGTSGSIVGDVTNNGTLAFNRSDTVTFGGAVSGSGALAQIGTGTTVLTGNNSYTGGTTISAGTLQLGNGGASGSITGNVTNNGTLAFNRADTVTFGGTISGSGAVSQIGTGTTILTGNNTYLGGTTVNGGTLQVAGDANLGDASGSLSFGGGTLRNTADFTSARAITLNAGGGTFQTTGNLTLTGTIGGSGALTKTDGGTLLLTANDTYTGGTTISAGTLQLGNGGTSGSIVGDVTNNGTLAFDRSDTATFGGAVSGSGALTQIGTGTTVLTGNNTYAGGTTISAGTLQLGNGGTSGSITGDVTNNGTLAFNRSDTVSFGGTVSGSGALAQLGTGTTVLGGNNTYTGGTTISAGTLQLGNGGTSGGIVGNVLNNGKLAFARADTVTYGGTISGSGAVTQSGTGTTILTGNNSYAGGTTVAAGALAIGDASHPLATSGSGDVSVASGASLGGYGHIAGSVQNGGTLAPANALTALSAGPTGTLQIGGSLTNSGTLQLAAANGRPGNVLDVGGNYVGGGRLVLNTVLNEGGAASQTDRLVVHGQASGQTAIAVRASGVGAKTVGDGILVVEVGPQASASSVQQATAAADRVVQRQVYQGVQSTSGSFQLAGPVQGGAYQYLLYQGGAQSAQDWYLRSTIVDAGIPGSGTPGSGAPGSVAPVQGAEPVPLYRPAVAGYALMPALNVDYGFSVLGRLHERVGDVAALEAAQGTHRDAVWGRVGGNGLDASAGRFSADSRTYFAQFGKDWTLRSNAASGSTHAGVTATIGSMSASFDDRLRSIVGLSTQTGTAEMHAQSLGAYLTRYFAGSGYVDAVAQITHYRTEYGDAYRGKGVQNGYGAGMSVEAGQPFAVAGLFAIEPQMQLMYQYTHLNHFDDAVSSVSGNTTHALRGRAGIRLFKANMADASATSAATPYLTADVLHDFTPMGTTVIAGSAVPGEFARTWYELGAGVSAQLGKSMQLTTQVKYANHIGGDARRNLAVQAGLRYGW
ncbi:autotransporter outer membrane beta-barrel domain-containing protein [Burkholderia dolosa]|uniref:autotransporter outer membrane beta-barrel domain-containing protein n=1 Tax=Burkholderia dolosa TaxID=152500 RepID=UPI001C94B32A|nr:autotransporter outer membrane beta-barrel domain-containing protein [Burkholderia dolosa]MBY4830889.1 autotransporter outer membrane beta-barrel domain-containing protein [Burkholderia dolosa]